jgi:hypothetical protein
MPGPRFTKAHAFLAPNRDPHFVAALALVVSVVVATFVTPERARAQSVVVVSLPEETPERAVSALVVELQLGGHEPVIRWTPPRERGVVADPFAHTGAARAVVIERSGRVVVADRDGPIAETRLDGSPSSIHPRALAMVAADLALRERPPPLRAALPPTPSVDLPRVRLADASDALSAPLVTGPSRALGSPATRASSPSPPDDPEVEELPRAPWPDWLRILTEISFGFAGSAVLGVPAALATDAAGNPDYKGGWLYGFAAAGPIGYALGAWLGGLLAGGDGNVWWTLLGGVVGGLVAGAFLLAGEAIDDDPTDGVDPGFTLIGALALLAAPTTLSILGYELSSD